MLLLFHCFETQLAVLSIQLIEFQNSETTITNNKPAQVHVHIHVHSICITVVTRSHSTQITHEILA